MSRKGITKKQFSEVMRRLNNDESLDIISARVGVKASTIQAIRQAGSYSEYEQRRNDKALKAQNARTSDRVKRIERREQSAAQRDKLAAKPATAKKGVSTTEGMLKKPVRGVAKSQAKKGVTQLPASTEQVQLENAVQLLNNAYVDYHDDKQQLEIANQALHDRLDKQRIDIRTLRTTVDKLEQAVATLQGAETNRSIRESKGLFTRLRKRGQA
jgi:hypothetical protein